MYYLAVWGLFLMKKAEIISAAVDLPPARSKMNETNDRLSSLKSSADFVLIRSQRNVEVT